MRLIPILLIAVALATSGCFGKDDGEGDDPPTVTTPAGNTTTTPTGTTPTTPTVNTTPTTPAKPAPKELCAVNFDFTNNLQPAAPPTNIATADCGTVAAGYTKLTLNLTFNAASGAPVYVVNAVSVSVMDSAGTAVLTCNGPSAGQAAAVPCSQEGSAAPGAYTLQFNGQGNVVVAGNVMAS